ncbi:hypothetical protein [Terrihalobacillus insolitus]|uniref:hypothetical protein n=1 Tax=Terrihalobacillus insolitus TaxID=2950438 RepID=UPI00233FB0E4|nr:hypothetical protein [Terrihalobacillus insolitus]MDC3414766.1 hypothetical protein [Terrihalobacillus insolitus]
MFYDIIALVFLLIIFWFLWVININRNFESKISDAEKKLKALKKEDKDQYLYSRNKMLKKINKNASWCSKFHVLFIRLNGSYKFLSVTSLSLLVTLFLSLIIFLPKSSMLYLVILNVFNFVDGLFQMYISNFLELNGELIYLLLSMLNNGLGLLLSLSLTVFIFTYRVRNNISISSNAVLQDNIPFLLFIFLTFIYGKLLLLKNVDKSLLGTQIENMQVFIWTLMFFISIIFGINRVLGSMLKSISFDEILTKTQKNTDKLTLIMCFHEGSDKELYKYLISCISSVYQTFTMSVKKNEGDSFRSNYDSWEKFITQFMQGRGEYLRRYVPYDSLNTIDEESFQSLYTTMLENHIGLIITLYNHNKILEAEKCLEVFEILTPHKKDDELYQIYFYKINELVNIIEMNHHLLLNRSLMLVRKYSEDNQKEMLGLMIYNGLLLKAVNENEVAKVSRIAYSMFDSITEEDETINMNIRSKKAQRLLMYMEQVNVSQQHHDKYKQSIIYTVLQMILKSIEQGNYAVTGFLIKMFVTKLNEQNFITLVKDTYKVFIKSKNKANIYFDQTKLERMGIDPAFNQATIDYCTNKLSILLYGQQKYAVINKLPGQPNYKVPLCYKGFIPFQESLKKCPYIPYLFNKLEKAKSEYGLIYLEDEGFMDSLKRDVFKS